MANVAINLNDITSLPGKVEKVIDTLQTLLDDIAPIEEALPLPSSVKTGFEDLQKFLAVLQGILSKV